MGNVTITEEVICSEWMALPLRDDSSHVLALRAYCWSDESDGHFIRL